MAYFNAMEESFEEVTILGKPALFTSLRIKDQTVPDGYHKYDVRHDDDCTGDVVQLAKRILVNHWGTLITAEEIELPVDGLLNLDSDALNYGVGECSVRNMADFMKKYPVL